MLCQCYSWHKHHDIYMCTWLITTSIELKTFLKFMYAPKTYQLTHRRFYSWIWNKAPNILSILLNFSSFYVLSQLSLLYVLNTYRTFLWSTVSPHSRFGKLAWKFVWSDRIIEGRQIQSPEIGNPPPPTY